MIKKILLGLGITFLSLVGFSNAGRTQAIGLQEAESIYNNSYMLTFIKGGGVLSNFLGSAKSVLAIDSDKLFWWSPNGLPYLYTPDYQGYFTNYYSCSELTTSSSTPSNCNSLSIDSGTPEILKNFFKNVVAGDYAYYNYTNNVGGVNCYYGRKEFQVCFSSSSIHQSLCFAYAGGCVYGCQGGANFCDGYFGGSLGDSNNYTNLNFGNIPYSDIGYAPGQAGYNGSSNIDGGSQSVTNSSITGNVTYSTCTNSKALNYYKVQGYNDKLCYSSYNNNSDIYTSAGSVTDYALTGLDISEVWLDTAGYRRYGRTGDGMGYNDWFQYWRKSFEVYNTSYNSSGSISNPFVGVPVSLFTLFGNVYSYGVAYNNQSIIEFCDLLLFTDPNAPYEGILNNLPCNYSSIDVIADVVGVHAESGQVVNGSSWEGILNRPGYHLDLGWNSGSVASGTNTGLSYFGDGKTFINNSFNFLSQNFKFPDRPANGIIPTYILVFMFALILFRFISH